MFDIVLSSLEVSFFAALGTLTFAYTAQPPLKAALVSMVLAAFAFGLRSVLMETFALNIVSATFFVAFLAGFGGLASARLLRVPAEVISLPSVIPMIPGLFAYQTILSFEAFYKNEDSALAMQYMVAMVKSLLNTSFITLALAIGIVFSLFVFYEQSFMMTRSTKHDKRSFWQFWRFKF
ncbi:MAG: threonine/serine exporter family protein [Helicobacter sp.]|nr:threonine/serine exporter family protein [Helicobacter sp.]